MRNLTLGIYWKERSLTLREYSDATRLFLLALQNLHPGFRALTCVGDRPGDRPIVTPDLGNLDDLIYQYSWDKELAYKNENSGGGPSWDSPPTIGYRMSFTSADEKYKDGIAMRIFAGVKEEMISNAVTMVFSSSKNGVDEFYDYDFIKKMFLSLIRFWNPSHGLVYSYDFYEALDVEGSPMPGWLTYLQSPLAAALRNDMRISDLLFDQLDNAGTLITLDRQIIDAGNAVQISKARLLRNILIEQQLIDV